MRPLRDAFIVLALTVPPLCAGCTNARDGVYTKRVLLLKCVDDMTDDGKCVKVAQRASDLRFVVNVRTQNIEMIVENDPWDEIWAKAQMLNGCRVADQNNWDCDTHDGIRSTYTMASGRFHHTVVGGPQPDFYWGGITGWRRLGVLAGAISTERAAKLE